MLVAAANPRLGAKVSGTEGWRRFTGAIHLGVDRFRRRPAAGARSDRGRGRLPTQCSLAVFLAGKALDIHVGFTAILAFFPAVAIVQTLPVTIGGLGVREGALYVFLHPLGRDEPAGRSASAC